MRFSRLSVRVRLTLGATLIAAVIFAIALIAVRVEVASLLAGSNEQLAASDVDAYASEIAEGSGGLADDSGEGALVYVRTPAGVAQIDTVPRDIAARLDAAEQQR